MKRGKADQEWLKRMAALEDDQCVSVGGWVTDLESELLGGRSSPPARSAFTRLLNLARRERTLSMEEFACEAGIDLAELVGIECDDAFLPTAGTVTRIARYLQLPEEKMLALAGLGDVADAPFREAAARFAARVEPVRSLTREEQEALTEFVEFLCQR
jgi:transcriptional regulator with XRE-family HTH domain